MPFAKPSEAEQQRIADEVIAQLNRSDTVPSGRNKSFAEMERAARAIAQRVATGLTAQMLAEASEDAPETAPCPKCQQSWRVTRKKRTVVTPDGPVEYLEPASHCDDCRCDFFPSASAAGSR